jgi:hypothetical protein
MKVKALFDYLANFLLEYASSVYSSAEVIANFQHIPGSNTAIKAGATAVCIKSSFFAKKSCCRRSAKRPKQSPFFFKYGLPISM